MDKNGLILKTLESGGFSSFGIAVADGRYVLSATGGGRTAYAQSTDLFCWRRIACGPEGDFSPVVGKGPVSGLSYDRGLLVFEGTGKSLDQKELRKGGADLSVSMLIQDGGAFHLLYLEPDGVHIAFSRDLSNWMSYEWDEATYPDNGVIYEGDYLKGIPYSKYIRNMESLRGSKVFDVRLYGAVGDGRTICTAAFNAAIADIRAAGGGVLLVEGGVFVVGQVEFCSNMTLFIERDSAVSASKDMDRFKEAFLAFVDVENVTITGGGRMIGNGEYFAHLPLRRPHLERLPYIKLPPFLYDPMGYPVDTIRYAYRNAIRYAEDKYGEGLEMIKRPLYNLWINNSRSIRIDDFIIQSSLDWTLSIDNSDDVEVSNVVIDGNRHVANTDGIDIMGSRNVRIRHCFISCADDGLCIKAPRVQGHDGIGMEREVKLGPSENIHISDCEVCTVMNSFKIGTETYYDIRNITVEDCHFFLSDIFPGSTSGINIASADGSNVENVTVRNITMENVCSPIFICLNKRNKFGVFDHNRQGGSIRNITIENVRATGMEVPCIVTGFQDKDVVRKLENICIRGFHAEYEDDAEVLDIREHVHENITDYPESNAFGDVPCYGMYLRHVSGLRLEDVEIVARSMNTRECIVSCDVDR